MDVTHMLFERIISLDNLLLSWSEFKSGKRGKPDVQAFERNLEENLFNLHFDLCSGKHRHAPYEQFAIHDPKVRVIHKATVRDRILHHAVYRILYPEFDRKFIFDSYSCRLGKGTRAAVKRLEQFAQAVSNNYRRDCFVLKCDISKFFASINQEILKQLLWRRVSDSRLKNLLENIIASFPNCVGGGYA